MEEKTSVFSNGLIWFGAAVSIAEILTGTLIAPLGLKMGVLSIIIGHVIGCVLLYFAGLIGAYTKRSSMETVKNSFGQKGSILFSSLNVLQLVGWTAVMIFSGATAANSILKLGGNWSWCLIIGALIVVYVLIGLKNINKINIVAISALFIVTIILCVTIFKGNVAHVTGEGMTFGGAVELSVAMPLSWLPLISDYTRTAGKPKKTTLVSAIVYFFVSCWMYLIGMGAALFTGESDIAKIMVGAGLGIAGLIIIVFSTVTTTFLDVYSAGVSSESISKKLKEKPAAIVVGVVGTLIAIFTPVTQFENFLYLIGSAFAPMTAILITDYFVLKKDSFEASFNFKNMVIWVAGFVIYRLFMKVETPVGYTLPVMLIIMALCVVIEFIMIKIKTNKETK